MANRLCKCGAVFDTESPEKLRVGGFVGECPDCSQDSTGKYTGVMVYSHKTAPALQINAPTKEGAALTAYLNRSSASQRNTAPPTTHGAVIRMADVSQSRRGDTDTSSKAEPTDNGFVVGNIWQPGDKRAKTANVRATWYDSTAKKLYRIADGKLYEAETDSSPFLFRVVKHRPRSMLAQQKSVLLRTLDVVQQLLKDM